jgi:hypothetical protein
MLSHAVSCCLMLSHDVLCCLMLSHVVQCCFMLYNAVSSCLWLPHAIQCCSMLSHALPCCLMLSHSVSCCPMLSHALPCCLMPLDLTHTSLNIIQFHCRSFCYPKIVYISKDLFFHPFLNHYLKIRCYWCNPYFHLVISPSDSCL